MCYSLLLLDQWLGMKVLVGRKVLVARNVPAGAVFRWGLCLGRLHLLTRLVVVRILALSKIDVWFFYFSIFVLFCFCFRSWDLCRWSDGVCLVFWNFAVWRCSGWRWERKKYMGYFHSEISRCSLSLSLSLSHMILILSRIWFSFTFFISSFHLWILKVVYFCDWVVLDLSIK